jgi:hypothetical protein
MKFHPKLPSAAMVVACIALVVALCGTSYAAVALSKNSVGTSQLKANAVTSAKIKNGTIAKGDLSAQALAATHGALAYGNFSAAGALEAGSYNLKGITLSQISPGVYCLSGFSEQPESVISSIDATGPEFGATVQSSAGATSECPAAAEVEVQTFNSKAARASEPFYVVFF